MSDHGSSGFTPTRVKTKKDEGLWIFSFADLTLILMSFFAMMLAMSKPNKQQFDQVVSTIKDPQAGQAPTGLMAVAEDLEKVIIKQKLQDEISVKVDVDGLMLEFSERLLFGSGSVKASAQFTGTAEKVLRVLSQAPDHYKISIEGHTDDVPLSRVPGFKNNWDLSAARGITLLTFLQARGVDPHRMRVLAYAATQPKVPIDGKSGPDLDKARRANRRVVIRLE